MWSGLVCLGPFGLSFVCLSLVVFSSFVCFFQCIIGVSLCFSLGGLEFCGVWFLVYLWSVSFLQSLESRVPYLPTAANAWLS